MVGHNLGFSHMLWEVVFEWINEFKTKRFQHVLGFLWNLCLFGPCFFVGCGVVLVTLKRFNMLHNLHKLSGLCGFCENKQVIEERDENAGRQEAYQIFQVPSSWGWKTLRFKRADRCHHHQKTGSQGTSRSFVAWKYNHFICFIYKRHWKGHHWGDFNCSC